MGPINKRFAANRFSPLDTDLGFQHTAKGMIQDVYEPESTLRSPVVLSPATTSLGSPRKYPIANTNGLAGYQSQSAGLDPSQIGSVRYSLDFLLRLGRDPSRQRYIPTIPILPGVNLDSHGTFPYSKLPFELRQMVLRELVPTKSIWNGTSFPKSCQYHLYLATVP